MSNELKKIRSFVVYDLHDIMEKHDLWREFLIINGRVDHDTSERRTIIAGNCLKKIEYNVGSDVEILSYNMQDGTVIITKVPPETNIYRLNNYLQGEYFGGYIPKEKYMWNAKFKATLIDKVLLITGKRNSSRYELIIPRNVQNQEGVRIHQVCFPGKYDINKEVGNIMEKLIRMQDIDTHDVERLISNLSYVKIVFPNFGICRSESALDITVSDHPGELDEDCPYCHFHLVGLNAMASVFLTLGLLNVKDKEEIINYVSCFVQ